jgi:hypothetical protein
VRLLLQLRQPAHFRARGEIRDTRAFIGLSDPRNP